MYFLQVCKSFFRLSNLGAIIFFLLNAWLVVSLLSDGTPERMLLVFVLYVFSVILALSPIGEWVVALFAGARKLKRKDMQDRITPIVERVYEAASRESGSALPSVIILKIMHDPQPNAYAIGRRTICVTEGLLDLEPEMIEGIIAHEFGHLAMHHTVIQLMIGGGNFFITAFLLILQVINYIKGAFAAISIFRKDSDDASGLVFHLIDIFTAVAVFVWTKFCMLFLAWSSRANEYEADRYAYMIGYGHHLAAALDLIGSAAPRSSLIKAFYASHPATHDRIAKLQELGVEYSRY